MGGRENMSAFLKTIVGLQSSLYLGAAALLLTLGSLLGSQEFDPWRDSLLGRLAIAAIVLGGIFLLVGTLGLISTCCSCSSSSSARSSPASSSSSSPPSSPCWWPAS